MKELNQNDYPLKIIKDLGMVGQLPKRKRKAVFSCSSCEAPYEANVGDVKQGKSSRCKACTIKNRAGKLATSLEDFVEKAKKIHSDYYSYSRSIYKGTDTKLIITCPTHGDFEQRPHQHLRGEGCKDCGYDTVSRKGRAPFSAFVANAVKKHEDKFTYDETTYTKLSSKTKITCPVHGDFWQLADMHSREGHGCPACSKGGFTIMKPGTLYYVYFPDYEVYKIGITNGTVYRRFMMEDIKYEILFAYKFDDGKDCSDVETLLLNNYKEYSYGGANILTSGNTELFTTDIFKGEYRAIQSDIYRNNRSNKRNVSRCAYRPSS